MRVAATGLEPLSGRQITVWFCCGDEMRERCRYQSALDQRPSNSDNFALTVKLLVVSFRSKALKGVRNQRLPARILVDHVGVVPQQICRQIRLVLRVCKASSMTSASSGSNRSSGIADMSKYRAATSLSWHCARCSSAQFTSLRYLVAPIAKPLFFNQLWSCIHSYA